MDYKVTTVCDSCQVKLQFKNEVTLTATLLSRDNATAKQLSLKGHSENGSFILDKQHKVDFIAFILLWGMGSSHTQLTFTKQNDLLVDNYSEGLGFILFAPGFGASSDHYDQRYARLKD